jgi:hypothetical protein
MSRTVLEEGSQGKQRFDFNVTRETALHLERIITAQLQDDRNNDRPERTRTAILEMILKKGIKTIENEGKGERVLSSLNVP